MLLLLLSAAVAAGSGCADRIEPTDVVFKRKDPQPPPPPPPSPTDPSLPGFFLDGMQSPARATLTIGGFLLVTDTRLGMVLRVSSASLLPDQGMRVTAEPSAVGLLDQKIYVGNPRRQTVDVYNAQGGASAGSFGSGAVGHASDIAVDAGRGLLFVIDDQAREVKVFSSTGALVQVIGAPGSGNSQFLVPVGIAVDTARQEILVADYGAPSTVKASIKIFGYDGTYVDLISGAGRCGMMGCTGGFSRPQGLAVSRLGKIFLADALLGQVLVFNRSTKALERALGGYPSLHVPSDVVIGANDDVFVVSNGTATIVRFAGAASQ